MRFDIRKEVIVCGGVVRCLDCPKTFKNLNFRLIIAHKRKHGKHFKFQGRPRDMQKAQMDTVLEMRKILKEQKNTLLDPYLWLREFQKTQDRAMQGSSGVISTSQPMKEEDDFFEAVKFTFEQLRPDTQTVVLRQMTDLMTSAYDMDHGSTPELLQIKKEEIKQEIDWDSD